MSGQVNIEVMRGQEDTARIYKWDLSLSGPGPGNAQAINLRCSSMDLPQPTYTDVDVLIRGFTKREAGAIEWNTINYTVIEMVSYEVQNILWNWGQKQSNNRTGVQLNKSAYEGDIQAQLLDLQDGVIVTWNLIGAVLQNVALPNLTSDKGGTQEITFTVSYDYADKL